MTTTIPKPRRATNKPDAKPEPEVIETMPALMAHMARHLEALPFDELVQAAKQNNVAWERRPKAAIIEEIVVREEERLRHDRAMQERMEKTKPVVDAPIPPDPALRTLADGTTVLDCTPAEMAVIFASLLPMDAVVVPMLNQASTWSRQANRDGQTDAVRFSRPDKNGVDRRYLIRVSELTALVVEPLP